MEDRTVFRRLQNPQDHFAPFPEALGTPEDFCYVSDLALMRFLRGIQTGTGKDALYVVERDYTIAYTMAGTGLKHEIIVPAGMLTDLVSVPPIGRAFVGRVGPHLEASIVHDFLYAAIRWEECAETRKLKRRFADDLLLAGVLASSLNSILARGVYRVVRWCGAYSVKKKGDGDFLDPKCPNVRRRLHSRG